MKKQGFTLIELMVVIVIMGILAAVAVPKLFGMIAKSKASEIGTAAGTYVKLQDAYVAEAGTYIGNWNMIGYTMPKSNNFSYTDGFEGKATTALKGLVATQGWSATNAAKLNDCQSGENWVITVAENKTSASTGNPIVYAAGYKDASATSTCSPLTPNFANIGK
ncbi:type IV pilin protein [Fibrobacter sp. UWEL]|uniref:type IV pilin protein n=1 Tax=Fibrobacter sp. UWEL TaxID=1896209 RepID=UPI00092462ED|nr:type II secretion system protein [Fibrobacter sp. UWEL]SHL10703.1 prepilin-type N-terminal cleavage/methylation domain-containing protein [Fibrobacter sp. UWEL]